MVRFGSFELEFIKRGASPRYLAYLIPVVAVVVALLVGSVLLLVAGVDPLGAYEALFSSAFGSPYSLSESVVQATPLMLAALGTLITFKAGFWNIGAEGQLQMGALAATWATFIFAGYPPIVMIPCIMVFGFLGGGAWGMIPAIFKIKLGADEMLTTMMMNYIAILVVVYFVYGPWRDPSAYGNPRSPLLPVSARLPAIPETRIHLTVFVGLVIAVLLYLVLNRTKLGLEIRIIGASTEAARYAGINAFKDMLIVTLIGGGISGLAGMGQVAGIFFSLPKSVSPGYGYTAIVVAWLARLNPLTIPVSAFLFGGLLNGGYGIQMTFAVPIALVNAIQALVLFFILALSIFYEYKVVLRWRS
jgi:simple sugar transport system permease protein